MLTKAQAHSRLASPQDRGQRGQAELPRPRTPPKVSSQGFSTLSWGSPTPEEKETGPNALFAGPPEKCPGGGNDNPLQYYCLEHPMDRGVWKATVYGVAKIQARLSKHSFLQQNENMGPLVRKLLRISRQKCQGINQVWSPPEHRPPGDCLPHYHETFPSGGVSTTITTITHPAWAGQRLVDFLPAQRGFWVSIPGLEKDGHIPVSLGQGHILKG